MFFAKIRVGTVAANNGTAMDLSCPEVPGPCKTFGQMLKQVSLLETRHKQTEQAVAAPVPLIFL